MYKEILHNWNWFWIKIFSVHSNTIRHWSQYKNNTLSNWNLLRWRCKKISLLHISIHRNVRVDWQFVSTLFRVGRPFLISMKNIFHSYLFFGPYWKRSFSLRIIDILMQLYRISSMQGKKSRNNWFWIISMKKFFYFVFK